MKIKNYITQVGKITIYDIICPICGHEERVKLHSKETKLPECYKCFGNKK